MSHFNEHQLQQIRNTVHDLDAMKESVRRRGREPTEAELTHWRQTGEWPALPSLYTNRPQPEGTR